MTTRRIASVIGLMLLGVSIASTASAQDVKTFPGLLCQPQTPTEAILRHGRIAAMTNVSAAAQMWLCPIVRDSTTANSLVSAQVVSSENVICELFSRTRTAELVDGNRERFKVRDRSGYFVSHYGALLGAASGFYAFRCLVPPGEQVVSYLVNER